MSAVLFKFHDAILFIDTFYCVSESISDSYDERYRAKNADTDKIWYNIFLRVKSTNEHKPFIWQTMRFVCLTSSFSYLQLPSKYIIFFHLSHMWLGRMIEWCFAYLLDAQWHPLKFDVVQFIRFGELCTLIQFKYTANLHNLQIETCLM